MAYYGFRIGGEAYLVSDEFLDDAEALDAWLDKELSNPHVAAMIDLWRMAPGRPGERSRAGAIREISQHPKYRL